MYEVEPDVFVDDQGRPVLAVPLDTTPVSIVGKALLPKTEPETHPSDAQLGYSGVVPRATIDAPSKDVLKTLRTLGETRSQTEGMTSSDHVVPGQAEQPKLSAAISEETAIPCSDGGTDTLKMSHESTPLSDIHAHRDRRRGQGPTEVKVTGWEDRQGHRKLHERADDDVYVLPQTDEAFADENMRRSLQVALQLIPRSPRPASDRPRRIRLIRDIKDPSWKDTTGWQTSSKTKGLTIFDVEPVWKNVSEASHYFSPDNLSTAVLTAGSDGESRYAQLSSFDSYGSSYYSQSPAPMRPAPMRPRPGQKGKRLESGDDFRISGVRPRSLRPAFTCRGQATYRDPLGHLVDECGRPVTWSTQRSHTPGGQEGEGQGQGPPLRFCHYAGGVGVFVNRMGEYVDANGQPINKVLQPFREEMVRPLELRSPPKGQVIHTQPTRKRLARSEVNRILSARLPTCNKAKGEGVDTMLISGPVERNTGGKQQTGKRFPIGTLTPDPKIRALVNFTMLKTMPQDEVPVEKMYRRCRVPLRRHLARHKDYPLVYSIRTGRAVLPYSSRSGYFVHKRQLKSQMYKSVRTFQTTSEDLEEQRWRFEEHHQHKRLLSALAALRGQTPCQSEQQGEAMSAERGEEKETPGEEHSGADTTKPVRLAPIHTMDLSPLDCPGKRSERPLKGFRTFYAIQQDGLGSKPSPDKQLQKPPGKQRKPYPDSDLESLSSVKSGAPVDYPIRKKDRTCSRQGRLQAKEESRREGAHPFYEPLQLLKTHGGTEQNQVYLVSPPNQKAGSEQRSQAAREEVNLHTVSVPRRGLIKLTALPYEMDNPEYYDDRKDRTEQQEQLRRWLEMMGPPLPTASGDPHRGWLIKDRTMIKQVQHGQQRLLEELADREKAEVTQAMLNSLVGGLLQYEIPEVPNMNKNLQTFVGVKPDTNNNKIIHRKQRSHSANIKSLRGSDRGPQNPIGEQRHSEVAYMNYITSPRAAFTDTKDSPREESPRVGGGGDLSREQMYREWSEAESVIQDDTFSLHNVLVNAQKYHLRRLDEGPKSKMLELPLVSPR
ncbi:uncharacterized protein LOC101864429 [Aplysia californica]|uniref:Uncharacterized protein LOC101864429 n=1 Tax=Aplysia californica TaxID=6500 RepID=A0ABM1AD46_APLCA|nr:uncharacterized protein LOC101864429 [Aplysia californica]